MTGVLLACLPGFVEGLQFLLGADLRTDPRVVSHPPRAKVSTMAASWCSRLINFGKSNALAEQLGTNCEI
jgi:hypothetical protein